MSKKNKLLVIGICALTLLLIGTSFAVWLVRQKQSTFNTITAGCIDITFTNGTGTLSFQNAAPITDAQGLALTGYTFTVRNNCNSEVSYLLNLDLFNVDNQTNLTTDNIKLAIDNKVPRKLTFYDDIAKNDTNAYGAKTLTTGTLAGKASESHTVKMWVDENTTTQNAVFSNRLFAQAGPDLTVPQVANDDCFIMDGNGKILVYKTGYCPNDVIIPNVIQGQTVNGIRAGAFVDSNVITYYDQDTNVDFIILDEKNYNAIVDKLTYLIHLQLDNEGYYDSGVPTTYAFYKASEYEHWDDITYDPNIVLGMMDFLDGQSTGNYVHRLNIPITVNDGSLEEQDSGNSYWWTPYYIVENIGDYTIFDMENLNDGLGYEITGVEPERYLHSIDFSRCTQLNEIGGESIAFNKNLVRIDLPNNTSFNRIRDFAFTSNGLTEFFIPTYTRIIDGNALYENNLTYIELYSANPLTIKDYAFSYNNITSLVVNSTITVNSSHDIYKPFAQNPLQLSGVTIGHNSTNVATDFKLFN